MNQKEKIAAITIGLLLVIGTGFVIVEMANDYAARAYELGLAEGMGMNKDAPAYSASVY